MVGAFLLIMSFDSLFHLFCRCSITLFVCGIKQEVRKEVVFLQKEICDEGDGYQRYWIT